MSEMGLYGQVRLGPRRIRHRERNKNGDHVRRRTEGRPDSEMRKGVKRPISPPESPGKLLTDAPEETVGSRHFFERYAGRAGS
jgi:hypothetical protein